MEQRGPFAIDTTGFNLEQNDSMSRHALAAQHCHDKAQHQGRLHADVSELSLQGLKA